ncbi:30S ribosomal protein S3 [bacterium]|jgi:small subunit ribosomal protein S3|nr:30S ribosomal protein S3 [bacterium]
MGQKVNPISLRLGIVEGWRGNWFANKKDFRTMLQEDSMIRGYFDKEFNKDESKRGAVTDIYIEKVSDRIKIKLFSARPGVVLGTRGSNINRIRDELSQILGKKKQVSIDVIGVEHQGQSAQFLADTISVQLEKRMPHRQAIKKAIAAALESGAKGIKVKISGRIGGAEISRSEQYKEGKVPLHTLRAKIDYAKSTAFTRSGTVGLKVWVYTGEVLEKESKDAVDAKKS